MKKILLIGILGAYNYGCEAIVRGTVAQIRQAYPDARIAYGSIRPQDDTRRLEGCDVEIIDLRKPWWEKYTPCNVLRKIFERFGVTMEYTIFANIRQTIKSYDSVISIGGDIYTLYPNGKYSTNLSYIGNLCSKYSIPYIIWGCSIGPFSRNPRAERYFVKHLKRVSKIVAREKATIDYLRSIGITENVIFAPDPAFYVMPIESRRSKAINQIKRIGINLSPHSTQYHYSNINQALDAQVLAIDALMDRLGCEVILLPHVTGPVEGDNDFLYLENIRQKVRNVSKVFIVDNDPGFIGIKEVLRGCDIIIAARMHCNINAVTCGVPTLFLAYSQKAKGMVDFVYQDRSLLIDIKDFEADLLVTKIENLLKNRNDIKMYIDNYDIESIIKELL